MSDCPYKDKRALPCDYQPHPRKKNIEYCRVCENWRKIDDIGKEKTSVWLWFLILLMVISFLLNKESDVDIKEDDGNSAKQSLKEDR